METVSIALWLLLAVTASGAVARMVPDAVPAPLVQIALGFAIGLGSPHRIQLDPELFFLLFLPPLLFLDGWRIPRDELRRDLPVVAGLALGLVVFTVLGAGLLIHLMVPRLPLAVCFCLAAVLSPTDPVAVSAIAERVPVPPRLMHILEGEALLNDASGLVCLRFAAAAAVSGQFSAAAALATFLWVALSALAIGVAFTLAVVRAREWMTRRYGEDAGWQVLVSLLIPFGAYLLAERVGGSGILAAVSAGITMSAAERPGLITAESRVRRGAVWDAVQFALNGCIFVLLGEQLPDIFRGAVQAVEDHGRGTAWWLLLYVLAITLGLAALRFAWVWASVRITLLGRRDPRPEGGSRLRLIGAASLAGVRGALTLAGILTLPLTLADGSPFPGRDFVTFLAASVILVSLVLASIGLPLLLRGLVMPPEPDAAAQDTDLREAVTAAALAAIERARAGLADDPDDAALVAEAADRVTQLYRIGLATEPPDPGAERRRAAIERELRLLALRAAREEAVRRGRGGEASSLVVRRVVRELDLLELRFTTT